MTGSMRRILLALVAFACIAPAAEAAQRDQRDGQPATRTAQQAKAPPAQAARAAQPRPAQATAPQARTQQAVAGTARAPASNLRPGDVRTSSSGLLVRGASAATVSREGPTRAATSCTRRDGRLVCGPARSSVAGWQSGLRVANQAQRDCPDGTFATLARGHDDVVRCMPF